MKIEIISTFPPRQCGIATYSADLVSALLSADNNVKIGISAINDSNYLYPKIVNYQINQNDESDYLKLAQSLNYSDSDIVSLQHEFGIYGGFNGRKILLLLDKLKKPIVITLHTVPIAVKKPIPIMPKRYKSRCRLLTQIFRKIDLITVMTESSRDFLLENFHISYNRVVVIPHGAPVVTKDRLESYERDRKKIGFEKNDFVLTTFGLISPKKGLEYVIKALPHIINNHKERKIKYLIAGRMHPKKSPEYLVYLKRLSVQLGVSKNVIFDNRYLDSQEIIRYLVNTNIYITPYYTKEQSSSGALTYAIASGCCIISTPYIFAQDILRKNNIGRLINFKDENSISSIINCLINKPNLVKEFKNNSFALGQKMQWPLVGKMFLDIFAKAVENKKTNIEEKR